MAETAKTFDEVRAILIHKFRMDVGHDYEVKGEAFVNVGLYGDDIPNLMAEIGPGWSVVCFRRNPENGFSRLKIWRQGAEMP